MSLANKTALSEAIQLHVDRIEHPLVDVKVIANTPERLSLRVFLRDGSSLDVTGHYNRSNPEEISNGYPLYKLVDYVVDLHNPTNQTEDYANLLKHAIYNITDVKLRASYSNTSTVAHMICYRDDCCLLVNSYVHNTFCISSTLGFDIVFSYYIDDKTLYVKPNFLEDDEWCTVDEYFEELIRRVESKGVVKRDIEKLLSGFLNYFNSNDVIHRELTNLKSSIMAKFDE